MNWKKSKTVCFGLLCALTMSLGGFMPDPVVAGETSEPGESVVLEDSPVQPEEPAPPEEPVQTVEETPPVVEPSNSQTDPIQDGLTTQDPPADTSNAAPVDPQPDPEPAPVPPEKAPGPEDQTEKEPEPEDQTEKEPDSAEPGSEEKKDPDPSDQEEPDRPIEFHVTVDTIDVVAKTTTNILPENAEMRVSRISEGNPEYQTACAALEQKQVEFDGMIALDISFWKDGQEIEPENGTVSVQTSVIRDAQMNDSIPESVEMHHISEQGAVEAQKVASAADGSLVLTDSSVSASFQVDSFSTFTITWQVPWVRSLIINGTAVDEQGKELSENPENRKITIRETGTKYAEDLAPRIEGYEFQHAQIGDSQDSIRSITFTSKSDSSKITYTSGRTSQITGNLNIRFVYRKKQQGIQFDANGGSTAPDPSFIPGEPGTQITLPDYTGQKAGNVFEGWSPVRNPQQAAVYHPVMAAGSYYTIPSGNTNQTLYAVWRPEGDGIKAEAQFYIRLDGVIPDEPGSHAVGQYTDYRADMTVKESIRKPYWLIDLHPGTIVSGQYYSNNEVSGNLNKFPSEEAVKAAVAAKGKKFDPETQYVHWYVQKYENGNSWHIDGVIMQRDLVSVSYDKNCPDSSVTVPSGYQEPVNTPIRVGRTKSQENPPVIPVRENYTFVGWNTSPDGQGTSYKSDDPYVLTTDTTFYAQWAVVKKGLTLSKRVTGELANRNKEFSFTVNIFDKDGNQISNQTCKLSHGGEKNFEVPVNGYYEIVENAEEYTPSYSINGGTSVNGNGTGRQHMAKNDTRVEFTNRKDGVVPTGINDHHSGLWTAVMALGIVSLFVWSAANGRKRESGRDC